MKVSKALYLLVLFWQPIKRKRHVCLQSQQIQEQQQKLEEREKNTPASMSVCVCAINKFEPAQFVSRDFSLKNWREKKHKTTRTQGNARSGSELLSVCVCGCSRLLLSVAISLALISRLRLSIIVGHKCILMTAIGAALSGCVCARKRARERVRMLSWVTWATCSICVRYTGRAYANLYEIIKIMEYNYK